MSGGNSCVNSLKPVSSVPRSTPGVPGGMLRRMDRMACVAHALGMTYTGEHAHSTQQVARMANLQVLLVMST